MYSSQSSALQEVEVILNGSLNRLNHLTGKNRKAIYDKYKEQLDVDDNNYMNEGVLYCNFLGQRKKLLT